MAAVRPTEELLFSLEIKKINGHHALASRAAPRARFWLAVAAVVVLVNSGAGLAEKVAQAVALVSKLTGGLP